MTSSKHANSTSDETIIDAEYTEKQEKKSDTSTVPSLINAQLPTLLTTDKEGVKKERNWVQVFVMLAIVAVIVLAALYIRGAQLAAAHI